MLRQPVEDLEPGGRLNPLPTNTDVTEPKVKAAGVGAGVGAGAGAVVSTFILWLLQTYAFHGDKVPEPVVGFVYLVVTVGLAALGAWWRGRHAPHQFRQLPPVPGVQVNPGQTVTKSFGGSTQVSGDFQPSLQPPRTQE